MSFKPRRVRVRWYDHHSIDPWRVFPIEPDEIAPAVCVTEGFLVQETPVAIAVSVAVAEDAQEDALPACCVMCIFRAGIDTLEYLGE